MQLHICFHHLNMTTHTLKSPQYTERDAKFYCIKVQRQYRSGFTKSLFVCDFHLAFFGWFNSWHLQWGFYNQDPSITEGRIHSWNINLWGNAKHTPVLAVNMSAFGLILMFGRHFQKFAFFGLHLDFFRFEMPHIKLQLQFLGAIFVGHKWVVQAMRFSISKLSEKIILEKMWSLIWPITHNIGFII